MKCFNNVIKLIYHSMFIPLVYTALNTGIFTSTSLEYNRVAVNLWTIMYFQTSRPELFVPSISTRLAHRPSCVYLRFRHSNYHSYVNCYLCITIFEYSSTFVLISVYDFRKTQHRRNWTRNRYNSSDVLFWRDHVIPLVIV